MKNDNQIIMLSIIVPTYNHENYIVEALDSIKKQKTKYIYEVLVGEDASTDNTREILKKYEKENPNFLTVFYREKNMSKGPVANSLDLRYRAKGKYIITLEGDDFWIDDEKIEKQIDFLEKHDEAIAVAHKCIVVGKDSVPNGETYPQCQCKEYTVNEFIKGILPGQLATIMMRNYIKYKLCDYSILEKNLNPGDTLLAYMLVNSGKVYCMNEEMTAYRHVVDGGSSYSANVQYIYSKEEHWWHELMLYASKQPSVKGHIYIEYKYLVVIMRGLRDKAIGMTAFIKNFGQIHYKFRASIYFIKKKILKI